MIGEIDQILEHGAGAGGDGVLVGGKMVVAEAQDEAAESLVGDDQVGATADDHERDGCDAGSTDGGDESFFGTGFGEEVGWTPDAEPGVPGEQSLAGNG